MRVRLPFRVLQVGAEYRLMKEREAGAVFNDRKARCYSPSGEYGERPGRFKVGEAVDEGGQVVGNGLVVWGCFCGQDGFVRELLRRKGERIWSLIETTIARLGSVDPDSLMALTRACSAHMGDWYVQMHDPSLTLDFAEGFDAAVGKAVTAAAGLPILDEAAPYAPHGQLAQAAVAKRARLPSRMKGMVTTLQRLWRGRWTVHDGCVCV